MPDIIQMLSHRFDIVLKEAVSDTLILKAETALGISLPDDIKQFYKFSNGLETDEYIFNIIKLEDIIENKLKWEYSQLYIAEYLIYSDTWELEVNPLNNNDYTIFNINQFSEKVILTQSFAEFLQRILNGGVFEKGGLYEWADSLRLKNSNTN